MSLAIRSSTISSTEALTDLGFIVSGHKIQLAIIIISTSLVIIFLILSYVFYRNYKIYSRKEALGIIPAEEFGLISAQIDRSD